MAVATLPAFWFANVAVGEVTDEIEEARLRLARLAATQADRVVVEAFHEIELMAQSITPGADADSFDPQEELRRNHSRSSSFHSGVAWLDGSGNKVAVVPVAMFDRTELDPALTAASEARDRTVSMPWLDSSSGHAMAALSIPVYAADGSRVATFVGVMDLAEPLISDLILPAARLGPSGHADLVDERGSVLASTEPGHVLTDGDHPDFYRSAAAARVARVDRAAHLDSGDGRETGEGHIMAYAPLQNAPWGVAMGAGEDETLHTVRLLQGRLIVLGIASLLALLLGVGLALSWMPRGDRAPD